MGEDAESDLSAAKAGTVDWRSYAARHPLNDKQSKISEKIRSREYKIANLRKECDRIVAKVQPLRQACSAHEHNCGWADTGLPNTGDTALDPLRTRHFLLLGGGGRCVEERDRLQSAS